jgi:16S rRNA G1207 methylase RsmC
MRSMGSLWLAACLEHLAPNGEIRIVANSFLPYSTFAQDLKLKSEMIAEIKGFKVWRMTR